MRPASRKKKLSKEGMPASNAATTASKPPVVDGRWVDAELQIMGICLHEALAHNNPNMQVVEDID
jgi:hypothetical protein